jgi:hypothetical protein
MYKEKKFYETNLLFTWKMLQYNNLKIKTIDENSIFVQKFKFILQFKVKFYKSICILILYPIICHLLN